MLGEEKRASYDGVRERKESTADEGREGNVRVGERARGGERWEHNGRYTGKDVERHT